MSPAVKKICENTYTTTDFHRRLGLLQECLEEALYHDGVNTDVHTSFAIGVAHAHKIGSPDDAQALEQWGSEVWSLFEAHNLVKVITRIKQDSETLPILTLYVPVAFDNDATKLVSVWCRENVNPQILLDMIVEPQVTGGCAFVLDDTYHDFSLHHAMKKNKGVVTQLLASYV